MSRPQTIECGIPGSITSIEAEHAYLVGIHRYSFRAGEPAKILGVVIAHLKDSFPRSYFLVRFPDGVRDLVAIGDHWNYSVISESDVLAGRLPRVIE